MAKKVVKKRKIAVKKKTAVRKRRPTGNRAMPVSRATNAYDLLGEIRDLIREEPRRYNQHTWLTRVTKRNHPDAPACGTIACVAGWVVALKPSKRPMYSVQDRAQDVLGLDHYQTRELFSGAAAAGHPGTVEHAKSGARHIQRFRRDHLEQLKKKEV